MGHSLRKGCQASMPGSLTFALVDFLNSYRWKQSLILVTVICLDANGQAIELTSLAYLPDMDYDVDVPLIGHLQT